MKKIIAIAWNDILIEFSERSTLVFFVILPVVFTLIIGQGLQSAFGSEDPPADPRYVVLVVDEDGSLLAERMVAALEMSEVVRRVVRPLPEAESLFAEQDALALLRLPQGFEAALMAHEPVELSLQLAEGPSSTLAIRQAVNAAVAQVDYALQTAFSSLEAAEARRPFASEAEREAYFREALTLAQELLSEPPVRAETNQSEKAAIQAASGFEQSSSGQLVTWTLITLLGASEVFVGERLGGTLRRLLVTPSSPGVILTGKILGRLSLGLIQMGLLIGFGTLVLGVGWGNSWAALALVVLSFALAAVALGVLLATIARSRGQASGLTVMLSMLLGALGGAWWPLEVTPPAYQNAVKVLPTTWAMLGFNDVLVRGAGVTAVLPEVGVLLGFALVFFIIGIWRFKYL